MPKTRKQKRISRERDLLGEPSTGEPLMLSVMWPIGSVDVCPSLYSLFTCGGMFCSITLVVQPSRWSVAQKSQPLPSYHWITYIT